MESKLITNNPRHLWKGFHAITDYRGSTQQPQRTSPSFSDDFNSFSARFDPSARPPGMGRGGAAALWNIPQPTLYLRWC